MARSWRQFIQRSGSFPLNLLTELTAVFDMGGATYCSVVGCSARISHNKGLTYHNVPKKGIGKDQWRAELLRKINRAGKSFNPDKARICSRHFTEDCFKYGKMGLKRHLIPGSLPTLWMPSKMVEDPKLLKRKVLAEQVPLDQGLQVCYNSLDEMKKAEAKLPAPWIGVGDSDTSLTLEETCKKKLKNLKDKMRDLCNKLPKTKSGQPAYEKGETLVRWPFYQAMLFMKDQFTGRQMREDTFYIYTQDDSHQEDSACSPVDSEDEMSVESSLPQPEVHVPRPTPRMCKKARLADDSVSVEGEKMVGMGMALSAQEHKDAKDEWSAFCSAIAFDLRKLKDPYLKMRVKADINQIVNDAVLQQLQQDAQPTVILSEHRQ